jgi:hypothetical protein
MNIPIITDLALAVAYKRLKTIRITFRNQDMPHLKGNEYVPRETDDLLSHCKLQQLPRRNDLDRIIWHLRYAQINAAYRDLESR